MINYGERTKYLETLALINRAWKAQEQFYKGVPKVHHHVYKVGFSNVVVN